MIDELDRIMTAYGTISVKTPDVWGQDRLAKFRSEYESQMAAWLKVGFKTDINASVRRSESDATRVQVGTEIIEPVPNGSTATDATSQALIESRHGIAGARGPGREPPDVERHPPTRRRRPSSPPWCSTSIRIT